MHKSGEVALLLRQPPLVKISPGAQLAIKSPKYSPEEIQPPICHFVVLLFSVLYFERNKKEKDRKKTWGTMG